MIERLEGMPPGTLGLRAAGEITRVFAVADLARAKEWVAGGPA